MCGRTFPLKVLFQLESLRSRKWMSHVYNLCAEVPPTALSLYSGRSVRPMAMFSPTNAFSPAVVACQRGSDVASGSFAGWMGGRHAVALAFIAADWLSKTSMLDIRQSTSIKCNNSHIRLELYQRPRCVYVTYHLIAMTCISPGSSLGRRWRSRLER